MAASGRAGTTSTDKERADAIAQMNLMKISRAYLQTMIDEVQGYKSLLLDKETMRICSTLFGRTELADHGVVHVEKIEANEGKDHHELKAICFVRPTRENVTLLKRELRAPRYQAYSLFFSHLVSQVFLQDLAEADSAKEQIQQVQEFYADFIVLDPHHFTIPTTRPEVLMTMKGSQNAGYSTAEYEVVDRLVQGLSALFLAIRRRPIIRYQKGSEHAYRLADSLYSLTYKQQCQIFDFGSRSTPVVLVLDRNDDPVTPLLTQWTYQAMVHELLGITDNTVKLSGAKIPEQFREVVLDARQDEFFGQHMYANYGDVGSSVKDLVDKFQSNAAKHKQVETLDDMRRFVLEHSDFSRVQSNISKHVNLMGELSEVVTRRNLMELSQAEQELANPATNLTPAAAAEDVLRHVRNLSVSDRDKARLVMLFALRFEADAMRVKHLTDYLLTLGVKERDPKLFAAVENVLQYAGSDKRAGDLYASRSLLGKAKTMFKGLQGVDNVYTQHTPLLSETLSQLSLNTLPANSYPFMAATQDEVLTWQATYKKSPPREVIVFILGGSTYEEAKAVKEWNERNPSTRVILGGSSVLNSKTFLSALSGGPADDVRVSVH